MLSGKNFQLPVWFTSNGDTRDWHSRCWHKAVSGSQERSQEFVSRTSNASWKKSVHLKDRRINVIQQTLQHCVSLTVIFRVSQSRAMQTSLNVILLGFFLWCLPKMYDVGWEQRKRETTPLLKSLKIPKALQDVGWCYPCVFVWGVVVFLRGSREVN